MLDILKYPRSIPKYLRAPKESQNGKHTLEYFFQSQLNWKRTVKADDSEPGKFNYAGIIDFGDIQRNYYIFELAITICYTMLDCKSMDILDAPGHVLAGYSRWRSIPDKEFEILKVILKFLCS